MSNNFAPHFKNKTVLITGAGGFLGQHLYTFFQTLNKEDNANITLIGCDSLIVPSSHSPIPQSDTEQFIIQDICTYTPNRPIDFIFHLAGVASPTYYQKHPFKTIDSATQGTKKALDIAKQYDATLVFFSSCEIYGNPTEIPTPETYNGNVNCLSPRACYDESKRLGETYCWLYHHHYGSKAIIIRPFNIYGPGMKENDFRVIPQFTHQILKNNPVTIYDTGKQTRTFCYITDAITGFIQAAVHGKPGEAYNIGNPKEEINMIDLVQTMETVYSTSIKTTFINYPDTYPANEPKRRCPDISKAKSHFNFQPSVSLHKGLAMFYNWTLEHY